MLQPSANTSNPLSLSEVKTEFGGGQSLTGYRRGGGYVANHQRNSAIPTSLPINLLSFVGTEKDFTSDTYTSSSSSAVNYCGFYYWESPFYDGMKLQYQPYGAVAGSISRIGKSKSSTNQAIFAELADYYDEFGSYAYFRVYGGSTNIGSWWDSITLHDITNNTDVTLYRSDTAVPGGTDNGSFALWYWPSTYHYFYFNFSLTYTFKITLS